MSGIGRDRELKVRNELRKLGWFVGRLHLSIADLVALKDGEPSRLVEVKANQGSPYMNFRSEDRLALRVAAELAGAEAWLAHWPARAELRWIPASEWPT